MTPPPDILLMSRCVALAAIAGLVILTAWTAEAPAQEQSTALTLTMPLLDPDRGRRLFVTKGCVLCHAVRGIGGQAAPPLDAPDGATAIDPLEFAARMWRGATAMIELQSLELGYQIELSAEEIADLAGFVGDPAAQSRFEIGQVPEPLRDWMLDIPYWQEDEEWPEDLPERLPEFDDAEEL